MMKWKKLGQIYTVANKNPYLLTHASNPIAIHLVDDDFRVFFSARNKENKSSVSFIDIDLVSRKIKYIYQKPLLVFGKENSFYSHGISIGNMYKGNDNNNYILFMGWQFPKDDHWKGEVGRILVTKNQKMDLLPKTTFMAIDKEDKISLSYPFVIFHDGIYKMWYGSTIDWTSENGEMIHVIKYATSIDGENWIKWGVAIPFEIGIAQAFSRPSVIIDENGYHMWYSYRSGTGKKYRIGYSYSRDGIDWKNDLNTIGIDVSNSGWDSEMICYPYVFDWKGDRYMLYNGNNYGKLGFGMAILEK